MPRSKPNEVIEHRVTLGTWERDMLKETQDARNVRDIGIGVGIAAAGVGGTYVAYKFGKAIYEWGEDAVDWLTKPVVKDGVEGPPRWVQILISGP